VGGSSSSSSAQKNFTPDTIPENEEYIEKDEQAAIAAALEQEGSSSVEDAPEAEADSGETKEEPKSLGLDLAAADQEIKAGLVDDLPDDLDELDD